MPVINIPPQLPCNTTKIAPFLPLQQSHCHKRQLRLGINHKKISKDYGIHTTLIKHGLHLNILTPVFFKPLTGKKQLNNWKEAIKDYNANSNMDKLIQAANKQDNPAYVYPAAWIALNSEPTDAPETKGKWILPTAGMANSLYTNLNTVNSAISKLGRTQF